MTGARHRIALVLDTLGRGGAERVLTAIANLLDPARFEVHVITTRAPGPLAADLAHHVQLHSLDRTSRWNVAALLRLAVLLDRLQIDIVHTHSHTAAYFSRLARALCRRKWLHVMHDHHGPVEGSHTLQVLDRLFLRHVDYYFCVSERLTRYAVEAIGIAPERCQYLRNCVVAPVAMRSSSAATFTVVQVARFEPEKNQSLALQVVPNVRDRLGAVRWVFVGRCDTPYGRRCRDKARQIGVESCVEFVGERDDVWPQLARAHVGVLTSRYEGLPIALLEYMAAGLPVVVTDVGEAGNMVRRSGGGVAVPADDAAGLSAALIRFALDRSTARQAGAGNRVYVEDEFGADRVVQRVMDVYERLLRQMMRVAVTHAHAVPSEPETREGMAT
jgi:glycosyltransferase involved in cell wall biosynthesis